MVNTGQLVVRADETLRPPRVGRVAGFEDRDRVLVLWGDARFSDDPHRARVEFVDMLCPAPPGTR